MGKRLQVTLLDGWSDCSADNPDGPITYCCDLSEESGALQVSIAEYTGGPVPNPTEDDLVSLARGEQQAGAQLIETLSGTGKMGRWGTAVFSSPKVGRAQYWYLSNGRDFILATLFGSSDLHEISDAQKIVTSLNLRD